MVREPPVKVSFEKGGVFRGFKEGVSKRICACPCLTF